MVVLWWLLQVLYVLLQLTHTLRWLKKKKKFYKKIKNKINHWLCSSSFPGSDVIVRAYLGQPQVTRDQFHRAAKLTKIVQGGEILPSGKQTIDLTLRHTDACVAMHTQCFPSFCEKTSQVKFFFHRNSESTEQCYTTYQCRAKLSQKKIAYQNNFAKHIYLVTSQTVI